MTIILTGGGSGGHITPILAIATELKKINSQIQIVYIGQKGDNLGDLPKNDPNIDQVYEVRAGKFRRYKQDGLKQLLDFPTIYKNIRDLFYIILGIFQSRKIISKINPDIVFSRGGYVSVPVCLGAKFNHINYITHDSDSVPSLANRLIAKWAISHFVALPKETYKYDQNKTITTGIPISDKFIPINSDIQAEYRQKLELNPKSKIILIVGGGQGAQDLNKLIIKTMPDLLKQINNLEIIHITGRLNKKFVLDKYNELFNREVLNKIKIIDYTNDLYLYSGSADLIITRAGATNLAEFAVQGKACLIIPSSFLTGGHQLKNAQFLAEHNAAKVINDLELKKNPQLLKDQIIDLLMNDQLLKTMSQNITQFGNRAATTNIAKLILEFTNNRAK